MTEKEFKLTKGIHYLVRDNLTWEEAWELLSEVVESKEWVEFWEMEQMLIKHFDQDEKI